MDWRPYKACCHRFASDGDVAFCPDCAHPLMRCMAFAECGSLLSPSQACPICVAPHLMMDKGAVVQSRKGERLSVPLILHNGSPSGRQLWIKRIVKWDGSGDEPVGLTWERIDAGTERSFALDTPPLEEGGTHTFRLVIVMASRYKGIEEEFAFSAGMSIAVSSPDTKNVYQTVTVSNNQFATGGWVNAQPDQGGPSGTTAPVGLQDRVMLPLERAEKYELDQGIRGYRKDRLRVARNVEFTFSGFRSKESPEHGATLIPKARLAFGRNSTKPAAGANAVPSDICLRAYDRTGTVDEPATMAISRHHFDLLVVNDRLCVQARTTRGMQVNTTDVASGEIVPIVPGDRIVPIPGRPEKLTLQVAFSESIGSVDRIDVSRTPPMKA